MEVAIEQPNTVMLACLMYFPELTYRQAIQRLVTPVPNTDVDSHKRRVCLLIRWAYVNTPMHSRTARQEGKYICIGWKCERCLSMIGRLLLRSRDVEGIEILGSCPLGHVGTLNDLTVVSDGVVKFSVLLSSHCQHEKSKVQPRTTVLEVNV